MPFRYDYFVKIKDKYCMLYAGHCVEYLLLLKLLRPFFEEQFKGLQIYLACRDDLMYVFNDVPNTLSKSKLRKSHRNFGYIKEIEGKMRPPHPIHSIFTESNLEIPVISNKAESITKLCCIFTEGNLPTKNMPSDTINLWQQKATSNGYTVWINPNRDCLSEAGWVIGVESEPLFLAASKGIKTTLVPTGIGTNLYKSLFPKGEVQKNPT